jgi:hypothetical protein
VQTNLHPMLLAFFLYQVIEQQLLPCVFNLLAINLAKIEYELCLDISLVFFANI